MRWLRCLVAAFCLVALGACEVDRLSTHDMSPGADPVGSLSPTLPDDWRWESYRDVEVGVPGDWGWGVGDQRLGQWCVNQKPLNPIVGRPGPSTLAACVRGPAGGPAPQTLMENTGLIVSLEDAVRPDGTLNRPARGGDRSVVTLGDATVVVQAPESLRTRIIATIHLTKVDHHECPAADSVSRNPGQRPKAPSDVSKLRGVTAVSVCKYALGSGGGLQSSWQYDGAEAAKVVDEIATSPKGGGPNSPQTCSTGYGDEIMVLRVTSATGESQIYVHYSACDHNGFDDGTTIRMLTRAPMQALMKGPNSVWSWEGILNPILDPEPGPKD